MLVREIPCPVVVIQRVIGRHASPAAAVNVTGQELDHQAAGNGLMVWNLKRWNVDVLQGPVAPCGLPMIKTKQLGGGLQGVNPTVGRVVPAGPGPG